MIPERVPGELADQAVVLVEVVPGVREDELGVDARLEILEDILHLGGRVRQVSVPERVDLDRSIPGIRQHLRGARAGLVTSLAGRSEDDPVDRDVGLRVTEREDGAAAADLEVVGVSSIASTRRTGVPSDGPRPSIRRRAARSRHARRRGSARSKNRDREPR